MQPALDQSTAVVQSAAREVRSAGRSAIETARRSPVKTAMAIAGAGLGLFLLLNGRARAAAIGTGASLLRRHGPDLLRGDTLSQLRHRGSDLLSQGGLDRLRDQGMDLYRRRNELADRLMQAIDLRR